MNGGLTAVELELRKQKAANLDAALDWIEGRIDCDSLITVQDILRRGLPKAARPDGNNRPAERAAL